jgi:hypothetical protein
VVAAESVNFFYKGTILAFAGHMVTAAFTQLSHDSAKAAIDKM